MVHLWYDAKTGTHIAVNIAVPAYLYNLDCPLDPEERRERPVVQTIVLSLRKSSVYMHIWLLDNN